MELVRIVFNRPATEMELLGTTQSGDLHQQQFALTWSTIYDKWLSIETVFHVVDQFLGKNHTARNAIQEIDRIALIVHTNDPSFSSARAERSSSSTSNETPSSSTSAGGSTSSDHSTGQSRLVLP